jgi:uncharacterized membrane protein YfcA
MDTNLIFFLICTIPAITLYGVAKSGLGGSMSLISIPLMTLVMPLSKALAIILPILILSDAVAVYKFRKQFDLDTVKLMVIGGGIGVIIGSLTYTLFSESTIKALIGLMGFCFTTHYFIFKRKKIIPLKKSLLKGGISSLVAGFASFCAHSGGTPTSIYLLPLRLKKEIYVGTRVIFFMFLNLIKLPFYIHLSFLNSESLLQSALFFPASLFGIFLGYQILKRVEEKLFYNIVYALILISSTRLIYEYISS